MSSSSSFLPLYSLSFGCESSKLSMYISFATGECVKVWCVVFHNKRCKSLLADIRQQRFINASTRLSVVLQHLICWLCHVYWWLKTKKRISFTWKFGAKHKSIRFPEANCTWCSKFCYLLKNRPTSSYSSRCRTWGVDFQSYASSVSSIFIVLLIGGEPKIELE